jgi:hypothetical protein
VKWFLKARGSERAQAKPTDDCVGHRLRINLIVPARDPLPKLGKVLIHKAVEW